MELEYDIARELNAHSTANAVLSSARRGRAACVCVVEHLLKLSDALFHL
jgi:hypothetical protein